MLRISLFKSEQVDIIEFLISILFLFFANLKQNINYLNCLFFILKNYLAGHIKVRRSEIIQSNNYAKL